MRMELKLQNLPLIFPRSVSVLARVGIKFVLIARGRKVLKLLNTMHHIFSISVRAKGVIMLKGFKEFVLRGNVIDLAIAVVVGAAFTGIVTQLTKSFIQPLIQVFGGGGIHGGAFIINGVAFDWAAFLNAIINFVIVAAVLYFFIVLPVNRITARRHHLESEAAPAPDSEDVVLLREIRDLLKRN